MKYYCPKRCVYNEKGGLCPRCGRSMKKMGNMDNESALRRIKDEQLSNKHT